MPEHGFTNALSKETSPYLLQHAHNPVQWYPWSEEALRRAKEEDKPILLSIGYSACHWCHVMERESFENEAVAQIMNQNFINVKVDREERPDLDAIYMSAVQLMTGRGGWPLTVFLTPEQIPFYGGTYFPPEDRHGIPGFSRVLGSVAGAYRDNRDRIRRDALRIAHEIGEMTRVTGEREKLSLQLLDAAVPRLVADYDPQHGGFGRAPKFPPSMTLSFLMRAYVRTKTKHLLEVVEHTLQKMATGGMYDQLGGGFHRYSVDQCWLVPHFEKMLYDNALLSRVYLDGFLLTGNPFYRRVSEETLAFVIREMTSAEGGFFSSLDADSEGEEGRFYTWTRKEVQGLLGEADAELFCRYFDISEDGNFEGSNILNVPRSMALVARLNNVAEEHLARVLAEGRKLLLEARAQRINPGRDDKILVAWNGLMLRSFAEAAVALNRQDYRQTAERNAEFITIRLKAAGRLLRSFKNGQAKYPAYLEDYACLTDGLLSLYEATFELRWLHEAESLAAILLTHFSDPEGGGFYFTADDHEKLIQRPKDIYDNATPSGNSVAAHALLRLWRLTGDDKWQRPALATLESMGGLMARHPAAFCNLLCGLDFYLSGCKEVALVGRAEDPLTEKMVQAVYNRYLPNKVVACGVNSEPSLLKDKPQVGGRTTAYVCENRVCQPPVTTPEELAAQLQ
jgi:uncharacterized protein YyaL (SSP411 family)